MSLRYMQNAREGHGHAGAIFLAFLKLGLTSFGGPIAHIGYFRDEFVTRRKWLSESLFGEIVTLCQFLPGPTSSQVGLLIGLIRGGPIGSCLAWLAFTTPSAIAMALCAYGFVTLDGAASGSFIHGLKLVAVVVVAQAVWGMSRTLTPDRTRIVIAVSSAALIVISGYSAPQLGIIALGACLGLVFCRFKSENMDCGDHLPASRPAGVLAIGLFGILLIGLPYLAAYAPHIDAVARIFHSGALVFGGGHVVLPLLEQEFVSSGSIDKNVFLAGYGAAQAVPGPLFTFASYLGVIASNGPSGIVGATVATVAIFLPGFLLLIGILPFWTRLRSNQFMRATIAGANAAVVGLLATALYHPIAKSAIMRPSDIALAVAFSLALILWRLPNWTVVFFLPAMAMLFT